MVRLGLRQLGHEPTERVAALLEVRELVVARARGREEHDVSGLGERAGVLDRAGAGYVHDGDLAAAVRAAADGATPGDIVLLSPACASYDQFRDYEERGEAFRRLVEALPGGA